MESGAPKDKIAVVYEGVEMPPSPTSEIRQRARQRLRIPDDAVLLGSVGVLSPTKVTNC